MKNMKIKVETDEHGESNLVEILEALERLGYEDFYKFGNVEAIEVETFFDGTYDVYGTEVSGSGVKTTLAELRSMNIETLEEMWDENY